MSIRTQTIWNQPEDPKTVAIISAKAIEMARSQVMPLTIEDGPEPNQKTYRRTWVDQAEAEAWVEFQTTLNPVFVGIVLDN